jgi:hypothetical protein
VHTSSRVAFRDESIERRGLHELSSIYRRRVGYAVTLDG